jgi:hypothetical protein
MDHQPTKIHVAKDERRAADKKRCQSCGMPINEDFFSTNADGEKNPAFCKFCFEDGSFTDATMTLDKMIGLSVDNMTTQQGINYKRALEMAQSIIPKLARWSR